MTIKQCFDTFDNVAAFYNPVRGYFAIRALKYFPVNSVVQVFSTQEQLEQPTYLSVQIGDDKHIHLFPDFLQQL